MRLPLYILLRQKEILELLEKNIFQVINSKNISINIQFINSQFNNEIKNIDTNKTFEKSCLVIQAYNNFNKDFIPTELLTIQ